MFDCDAEAMMDVGVALKEGIGVPKDEKLGSMYMKYALDIQLDLMKEDKKVK